MSRTNAADVRKAGSFPDSVDVDLSISTASILVDDIDALGDSCMNDAKLQAIEMYLAAHYTALNNPKLTSKTIAGASSTFEGGASGEGFRATRFGQQAALLDCTGYLRDLENGKAEMMWLGKSDD